MSNGEIIRRYNSAKLKGEQIKMLSQLNCCEPDQIIAILLTKLDGRALGKLIGKYAKGMNKEELLKKYNLEDPEEVEEEENMEEIAEETENIIEETAQDENNEAIEADSDESNEITLEDVLAENDRLNSLVEDYIRLLALREEELKGRKEYIDALESDIDEIFNATNIKFVEEGEVLTSDKLCSILEVVKNSEERCEKALRVAEEAQALERESYKHKVEITEKLTAAEEFILNTIVYRK